MRGNGGTLVGLSPVLPLPLRLRAHTTTDALLPSPPFGKRRPPGTIAQCGRPSRAPLLGAPACRTDAPACGAPAPLARRTGPWRPGNEGHAHYPMAPPQRGTLLIVPRPETCVHEGSTWSQPPPRDDCSHVGPWQNRGRNGRDIHMVCAILPVKQ